MPQKTQFPTGKTITSNLGLTPDEADLIHKYVNNFEWAKALNEDLRSGKKREDGETIAKAIEKKGLVTTGPMMLYRRAGLHDPSWDPQTHPIASFNQATIISTWTNKANTAKWYGDYIYCIYLPAGECYIEVEHALVGGNAIEVLLGPGKFIYNNEYIKTDCKPSELLVVYHTSGGAPTDESTFARANALAGFKTVVQRVVAVRTLSRAERERARMEEMLAQADALAGLPVGSSAALIRLSSGSSGTPISESSILRNVELPRWPTWDQAPPSLPGYEWAPPSGGVIFDIRRSKP